jgi:carboxypeptidase C (cathepsin A)
MSDSRHRRLGLLAGLLASFPILASLPVVDPGLARDPPAPGAMDADREPSRALEHARPAPPSTPPDPLPAAVTTSHKVELPGRTLEFDAIAGAIQVLDGQTGKPEADVAFVAFLAPGKAPPDRPVTFAINGGPGAGSAWLDLGAIGPWRLPLDGASPSRSPRTIDNAETWLDFTDLVFIDPPGTGYSRILGKAETHRHRFYSVAGDIEALAVVIRKWLATYGRLASPKFMVGESYGGFRGPKLARRLQDHEGIGLRGLVLVSPVLDFSWFNGAANPLPFVTRLPSQAAVVRGLDARQGRAGLADVEAYAAGPYIVDLLRGTRDAATLDRIAATVARFTGLDPALVRTLGGRVDLATFSRERDRSSGKISSIYDGRISGFDAAPYAARAENSDPVLDAAKTPLATAMAELTSRRLGWNIAARYEILNEAVNRQWDWGTGKCRAEALSDLSRVLALDPEFRVLVAHGLTDLVTPYFATKLLLDQVPSLGAPDRLELEVYSGGHMFYFDDTARAAFRTDARRLIERK